MFGSGIINYSCPKCGWQGVGLVDVKLDENDEIHAIESMSNTQCKCKHIDIKKGDGVSIERKKRKLLFFRDRA